MLRTAHTWLIFIGCLVAVIAAVVWISVTVFRLESQEIAAQREAFIEENARTALWRMDAIVASRLSQESSQTEWVQQEVVSRLHGDGTAIAARDVFDGLTARALLDRVDDAGGAPAFTGEEFADLKGDPEAPETVDWQMLRTAREWNARQRHFRTMDRFRGLWIDQNLAVLSVSGHDRSAMLTIKHLAWPTVREELLAAVIDLFPGADLQPLDETAETERTRLLATLPVQLVPGTIIMPDSGRPVWIRLALMIAWSLVLLPALGVAILLFGTMSLNERRAAFVSAVTHELRTPLTTFRMYAEMLHADMVPPDKRREYLQTLRTEADRLSHLVENVLAYAGLERGRSGGNMKDAIVGEVIDHIRDQLADIVDRADMKLEIELPAAVLDAHIRIDVSAVERVLFNLVDNACKYARDADDRRICMTATANDTVISLRIRDYGPGVHRTVAKRLFRPFSKSASEAADSAPGVGLGLALSRRLAVAMGGDLIHDCDVADGAAFVLTLVRTRTL
jgi:signal transduction histidine kinase